MKKIEKKARTIVMTALVMLGTVTMVSAQGPFPCDPDSINPCPDAPDTPIDNPMAISIVLVLGIGLGVVYLRKNDKTTKLMEN